MIVISLALSSYYKIIIFVSVITFIKYRVLCTMYQGKLEPPLLVVNGKKMVSCNGSQMQNDYRFIILNSEF